MKRGDPLLSIAITALIAGFLLIPLSRLKERRIYDSTYRAAEEQAVYTIGDYKPPLSELEKTAWYQHMHVTNAPQPTLQQLQAYIATNSISRKHLSREYRRL